MIWQQSASPQCRGLLPPQSITIHTPMLRTTRGCFQREKALPPHAPIYKPHYIVLVLVVQHVRHIQRGSFHLMASRATNIYNSYARRDANPNYLPRAKALGNYDRAAKHAYFSVFLRMLHTVVRNGVDFYGSLEQQELLLFAAFCGYYILEIMSVGVEMKVYGSVQRSTFVYPGIKTLRVCFGARLRNGNLSANAHYSPTEYDILRTDLSPFFN